MREHDLNIKRCESLPAAVSFKFSNFVDTRMNLKISTILLLASVLQIASSQKPTCKFSCFSFKFA